MYQEITFSMFTDAFRNMGRKDQFTYNGLKALFDYLENYEEETGEKVELDVIALCCEYTEYEDIAEYNDQYGDDIETLEQLEDKTTVIRIQNSEAFIIQNY